MAKDFAKVLAQEKHALVIAPAGCGKTHLISEATLHCTGRQLVLTHTHAGVKAIRDRMAKMSVPSDLYRIATLDSFALRYATAFPTLSGWNTLTPKGEEWQLLRPAAAKILGTQVARKVLKASYAGVFVDEYQDCSIGQHLMIERLASVLPCRVLGDPLQSVFAKVNKTSALPWATVEKTFPLIGELTTPYRWVGKNEPLGKWLLEIRATLLKGGEIDLQSAACVRFVKCDPARQALAECLGKMNVGKETVVGLYQRREQCHFLAGNLQNRYAVFEDGHAQDLMVWAEKIDASKGIKRIQMLGEFAQKWLTRVPKVLVESVTQRAMEGKPTRAKRADLQHLAATLAVVRESQDTRTIVPVLDAYLGLDEKPMFKSREIWSGLRQAALESGGDTKSPLHDASWRHRDHIRRNGRKPASKCLATPLLVKGLEFDHALILNAADFPESESLYVSLTRASKTMTILGESPILSVKRTA
jgi:superfamily I DNA/RNA helicase